MKTIIAFMLILAVPAFATEIDTQIDTTHRGYELGIRATTPTIADPTEQDGTIEQEGTITISPEAEEFTFMPQAVNDIPDTPKKYPHGMLSIGIGALVGHEITYRNNDFDLDTSPAAHITFQVFFTKHIGIGISGMHAGGDSSHVDNFHSAGDEFFLQYRLSSASGMLSLRWPMDNGIEPYANLAASYNYVSIDEKNADTGIVEFKESGSSVGGFAEIGVRYMFPKVNLSLSVRYSVAVVEINNEDVDFGGFQAFLSAGCHF